MPSKVGLVDPAPAAAGRSATSSSLPRSPSAASPSPPLSSLCEDWGDRSAWNSVSDLRMQCEPNSTSPKPATRRKVPHPFSAGCSPQPLSYQAWRPLATRTRLLLPSISLGRPSFPPRQRTCAQPMLPLEHLITASPQAILQPPVRRSFLAGTSALLTPQRVPPSPSSTRNSHGAFSTPIRSLAATSGVCPVTPFRLWASWRTANTKPSTKTRSQPCSCPLGRRGTPQPRS